MEALPIQPRNDRSGKSAPLVYEALPADQHEEARIIAEIKDMVRIRLADAAAFRASYQQWVKQWD